MTGKDLARKLLEDEGPIDPKDYLRGLTRRGLQTDGQLILVGPNPEDSGDPIVQCPKCGFQGNLMSDFSYLAAGFNGIEPGDEDDIDAQECGRCGAKLEWQHIPEIVESHKL